MSTVNKNVVTNGAGLQILSLMPCSMEEADERIFVHVKHVLRELTHKMIKTFHSNVVVIAIANFHQVVPLNKILN